MYYEDENGALNFIAGMLIGAVVGATVALLAAPYTGKKTRRRLMKAMSGPSIKLRIVLMSCAETSDLLPTRGAAAYACNAVVGEGLGTFGAGDLGPALRRAFPDQRFVVVSNREPYEHVFEDGAHDIGVRRPAGGLVAALD